MRLQLAFAIGVGLLSIQAAAQSPRPEDSTRKWREDLAFLQAELPRQHPKAFHDLPKEAFDGEVAQLAAKVPQLTDAEILAGLGRIVASLGPRDGHTHLNFASPVLHTHLLPLSLYDFSDGLYLRSAAEPYRAAVGGRLISIGGTPADVAWKKAQEITPADNEMSRRSRAVFPLIVPELLQGLGIISRAADPAAAVPWTFELAGGKRVTVDVAPASDLGAVKWVDARESSAADGPLYLRHMGVDPLGLRGPEKFFFMEYLANEKLLYVKFNAVANAPDETVAAFFQRVFAFADSHEVDRFVLDVRNNGGGNNGLNRPILLGLIKRDETINRPGHLFVITGRETFSAAQNLVTLLERYTSAIFVGEPSGGSPNHYGDARPITLPNSGIPVMVSTLWWQDSLPDDPRVWVAPRLAAELSFADYRSNRDPALEAVLRYSPGTLVALLRSAVEKGGKPAAAAALERFRSDPLNKYASPESEINGLGYALLGEKKLEQAIAIFQLNAETFSSSWNVFDSLGEALAIAGRRDEAIRSYQHALDLNPRAVSARQALERLSAGGAH